MRQSGSGPAVLVRDIYNARVQICTEALAGRTPIQALMLELDEAELEVASQVNSTRHLTHLFFAFHKVIELFGAYSESFLLDCTYKTNRFNVPLLNAIGITDVGASFYLSFTFLRTEQETDYVRALRQLKSKVPVLPEVLITDRDLALINAIEQVFPDATHLLCQWHIQKNIVAKCKPFFTNYIMPETAVLEE